ncbi:hypothetical protein CPSG_03402 [Coccidioides posadasii str. Silveira]|uniref:Secreted protein n=1 Tax=Coccidioides posadasii (strain RMSCC 757 / Silveira) TaxID=443226 RepID=E9CZX4_COCPS|nr:hypothetical protein CPSG_03402 [Coccidioides posadasii str. Silveira]
MHAEKDTFLELFLSLLAAAKRAVSVGDVVRVQTNPIIASLFWLGSRSRSPGRHGHWLNRRACAPYLQPDLHRSDRLFSMFSRVMFFLCVSEFFLFSFFFFFFGACSSEILIDHEWP